MERGGKELNYNRPNAAGSIIYFGPCHSWVQSRTSLTLGFAYKNREFSGLDPTKDRGNRCPYIGSGTGSLAGSVDSVEGVLALSGIRSDRETALSISYLSTGPGNCRFCPTVNKT